MRTLLAFGTAMLLATPQSTYSGGSSSGDGAISPAVVASWIVTGFGENAKLELLVLWRGTPGWFFQSSVHGGGARGAAVGPVLQRLNYGGIDMSVSFDVATRVTRIQDREVALNGDNVVLVDDINAPGGPKVVGTKKVETAFPETPRIAIAIKRAPELHPFLRCDAHLENAGQQAVADRLCSLIIR